MVKRLSLSANLIKIWIMIFVVTIGCKTTNMKNANYNRLYSKFMSLELQKISSKQVEEIFGKAHESEIIDGELYWFYFDDKFKPVDARVTIGFSKDKKVSFKNINLLDDTFQVTVPNIKNQFKEASFIKEAVKSEVPHIVLFDYRLVDSKRGIDIYVKYDGEDIEKVKYVSVSTPKVTQVLTNK